MCLAIYKPVGQSFDMKDVRIAWENNPHGAGLAFVQKNGVKIYKGIMSLAQLESELEKNAEAIKNLEAVIHLRWATSGNVDAGMTHPFPVSAKTKDLRAQAIDVKKAVIHNGVMFSPTMGSKFSDTAIFSRWLSVCRPSEERIKQVIGEDRVVILTKKGAKFYGAWVERKGCLYSNLYSLQEPMARWDWRDDDKFPSYLDYDAPACPICDSEETETIGVRTKTHECLTCGTVFNETEYLIGEKIDEALDAKTDHEQHEGYAYHDSRRWG